MKCPECGADGRVCYVKEDAPGGVEVTYLCPNRRCRLYGQDCAVGNTGTAAERTKKAKRDGAPTAKTRLGRERSRFA